MKLSFIKLDSTTELSKESNFATFSTFPENLWAMCFHCDIHCKLIHCIHKVENLPNVAVDKLCDKSPSSMSRQSTNADRVPSLET